MSSEETPDMLLKIHAEGQTEQGFVEHILRPYLEGFGYTVSVVVNPTSPGSRGGLSHYHQFKKNAKRIRKDAPNCLLTTMIDLYGLPSDFPGMEESKNIDDPTEHVLFLEEKLIEDLELDNFVPYIQLHEFEALLFSDIEKIDQVLRRTQSSSSLQRLRKVLDRYGSPENIDHEKGPSLYLQDICGRQRFAKTLWGLEIARMIDLQVMREMCPHFDRWLTTLEKSACEKD